MAFNIYISHNTSPWELANVYALANEANRQGLDVFVPDRTWNPHADLPPHIFEAVSRSNIIVLFATLGGHFLDWVNTEMTALKDKPVLALVEPGIQIQNIPTQNIVWFDRQNVAQCIGLALKKLQSFKLSKEIDNMVSGFVVGVLALLVLRALTRRD